MAADNQLDFQQNMENQAILQTNMSPASGMIGGNLPRILTKQTAILREATAQKLAQILVDEVKVLAQQLNLEPFYENDFPGDTADNFADSVQRLLLQLSYNVC